MKFIQNKKKIWVNPRIFKRSQEKPVKKISMQESSTDAHEKTTEGKLVHVVFCKRCVYVYVSIKKRNLPLITFKAKCYIKTYFFPPIKVSWQQLLQILEKQIKASVETSPTLFWHISLQAPAVPVWKPHKSLFALPAFLVSKVWLQPAKLSPTISSLWIWNRGVNTAAWVGHVTQSRVPLRPSCRKWQCSIFLAHWWRHTSFQSHTWEHVWCTLKMLRNQTWDGADDSSSIWFWSISVRKKQYNYL